MNAPITAPPTPVLPATPDETPDERFERLRRELAAAHYDMRAGKLPSMSELESHEEWLRGVIRDAVRIAAAPYGIEPTSRWSMLFGALTQSAQMPRDEAQELGRRVRHAR